MVVRANDIPPELSDRIIDSLGGDIRSLKSCALVQRSWLPRCRAYLHNEICVLAPRSSNAGTVERVLARYSSPVLLPLVNRLRLYVGYDGRFPIDPSPTITLLLRHFPPFSISYISLVVYKIGRFGSERKAAVSLAMPYPREITLEFVTGDAGQEIVLKNEDNFFSILRSVSGVSRLAIQSCLVFAVPQPTGLNPPGVLSRDVVPKLRSLSLSGIRADHRNDLLRWLCKTGDSLALEDVELARACSWHTNDFLSSYAGSIHTLRIIDFGAWIHASLVSLSDRMITFR